MQYVGKALVFIAGCVTTYMMNGNLWPLVLAWFICLAYTE